ncbi:MAG: DUF5674 family protein [Lachnospiraceae bacterium]
MVNKRTEKAGLILMRDGIFLFCKKKGSKQESLWGINLYPEETEDFIEFDSLINIRPRQNNKGRGVYDETIRNKIVEVVNKWIQ